jgi:hypothetical protein
VSAKKILCRTKPPYRQAIAVTRTYDGHRPHGLGVPSAWLAEARRTSRCIAIRRQFESTFVSRPAAKRPNVC